MGRVHINKLTSILSESPFYRTLSAEENHILLARLAENYPFLLDGRDDELEVGYESSWTGITTPF